MQDILLDIATAGNRNASSWKNEKVWWSQIVAKCTTRFNSPETFAEFMAGTPQFKTEKKDVGGFVSGFLSGGSRAIGSVMYKQIVTLDADYTEPGFLDRVKALGIAAVYYTTHSHTPQNPRYRILFPLDQWADPLMYEPIARKIAQAIGIENVDRTSYDLNRLMFWPSTSRDGVFESGYIDGPIVSRDQILASYAFYTDASSWPIAASETKARSAELVKLGDPKLKPGIVGLFCRVYDIHDCIEHVLPPDTYVQSDLDQDRYTYSKGSTPNGLIVYDNYHAYSHHGTDPVSGQTVNAFDLMRLHLFGEGDDNMSQPMPKRKSFIAAAEYAASIPQVKMLIMQDKFSAADEFKPLAEGRPVSVQAPDIQTAEGSAPAPSGSREWMGKMDFDKQLKPLSTLKNMKLILENDPALAGCFAFDKFANRLVLKNMPAWRSQDPDKDFRDTDDAYMREYFETVYGISGEKRIMDALSIAADKARFHPVREYLNGLVWDGVGRIELLFNAFLGAEDSQYTRQVSRKWFTAAVARVLRPGIKFDNMIIFVGDEGIGKSTLVSKLGGDWFSDTSIDLRNKKDSMEDLQGVWIMEWAELTSFRTASVEAVKSFVSKQTDRFRPAYGRRIENYPRQCIFMGSTNIRDFLSDPDGNRRFWPVLTKVVPITANVHTQLDEYTRGQVWAEAVTLFKSGEPLNLDEDMVQVAKSIQKSHTEMDDRIAAIEAFMEREIPADWYMWDEPARATWNMQYKEGQSGPGYIKRPKVCASEIWLEALNGTRLNMTKANTRFIHNYLRNKNDWAPFQSTTGFGPYGQQKGYYRS